MNDSIVMSCYNNFMKVITTYAEQLNANPLRSVVLIIDIIIVILLFTKLFKIVKDSRAWHLLKGICLLIISMAISSLLHLDILNYILTSFVTYGTVFVVLFQPELRRSLEELGSNKLTRFFGLDKDIETKTKEENNNLNFKKTNNPFLYK